MSSIVHPRPPAARRRGTLRRLVETRGIVGGHVSAHVTARLTAADGTPLVGSYLPAGGSEAAVLLLHGFGAHRRKPAYAYLADGLASRLPVLALDLRGHGASGGASTFGDREVDDVAAGVAWLRAMGHRRVIVVGLSMGATAAMHAAARGIDLTGLVVISATARFRTEPETEATRRLKRVWDSPVQRRTLRLLLGVDLAGPEQWGSPAHPVEMVTHARCPLLVVHGEDDAYFPMADAEELTQVAAGPSTLWREPAGFGHAEDGVSSAFVIALRAAVVACLERGQFPGRPGGKRPSGAVAESFRHRGAPERPTARSVQPGRRVRSAEISGLDAG